MGANAQKSTCARLIRPTVCKMICRARFLCEHLAPRRRRALQGGRDALGRGILRLGRPDPRPCRQRPQPLRPPTSDQADRWHQGGAVEVRQKYPITPIKHQQQQLQDYSCSARRRSTARVVSPYDGPFHREAPRAELQRLKKHNPINTNY